MLTLPGLLRRRWVTVAVSAASAFIVVYLPHVLGVGGKVIGFLPGYLQQENYTSGTRYGIIGLFVIGPLASAVAVLVLAAIALAVLQFSDPDRPWRGALYMTAGALAVTTPHYQWYSLLLVMLVALDGRPEWLAFAAGGYYAAEPDLGRYHVPSRLHDAHRLRRTAGGRGSRLADPARAGQARAGSRGASGRGTGGRGAGGRGADGHGAGDRGAGGRGAGARGGRGSRARTRGPRSPGLTSGSLSYRLVTPRANIKRHRPSGS